MGAFLPHVFTAGGLAATMGLFSWLAARARRNGAAGAALRGALAAYDEAYHTTAHQTYQEQRVQTDRKAPLESPDDL